MAFEDSTEVMTCHACKADHSVKWSRMPVRERLTVRCKACGDVLFEGNTVRDYYDVILLGG